MRLFYFINPSNMKIYKPHEQFLKCFCYVFREQWRDGDANVLINLVNHTGKAEIKCIAVNPTQPELLAIGANDPFVRIYDRRKLSLKKMLNEPGENMTSLGKLIKKEK